MCGDGLVAGNEACDDNNTISGDGCSDSCTIEAGWYHDGIGCVRSDMYTMCGDSIKTGQELLPGRCETGGNIGCNGTCHVECGYVCSGGSLTGADTCLSTCGDGVLASNESCDDGNTRSGEFLCTHAHLSE
jgi:cysteine-rich repeat protein